MPGTFPADVLFIYDPFLILLIEDSPGECELFRLALTQTGLDVALYTEQDAEAAFCFVKDQGMPLAVI